jgi:CubicO group peptidase (beta-lactamase class C family)
MPRPAVPVFARPRAAVTVAVLATRLAACAPGLPTEPMRGQGVVPQPTSAVDAPVTAAAGGAPGDSAGAYHTQQSVPADVGMLAERLAVIDRVVSRGIAEGGYPGAALVVGRRGRVVWSRGYGARGWSTGGAVSPDSTLYDLASLTKVVGTTSAVMALVDDGRLALDAPVRQYLPGFAGVGKGAVTVRHLLEHRSGLAAGAALWRHGSPAAARRQALAAPLQAAPEQVVEYSDLGMIVLGAVVEAASGEPMDAYLQRRVFGPLGMRETTFRPAHATGAAARLARLAPTGAAPAGRVHDGNAAALGGVAGHAGLFATAADLAIYAQTLLAGGVGPNGVRVFADSTTRAFLRRGAGATRRALGWETCGTDRDDACGRLLGERAVMHTGFTGTFLVLDPERQAFAVLLANRVYAPRAAQPARVIRDVRADVSDALALAVADAPGGPLPMPLAFRSDGDVGRWHAPVHAGAPATQAARTRPARPAAARLTTAAR